MFIDFHTHIYPDDKAAPIIYDMTCRGNIRQFSDGTLSGLLDSMNRSGIGLSVISRITTQADKVETTNKWLLECIRPNVLPMATVHPDRPVTADDLETLRSRGFMGVKLHPDYQDFFVDDPRMYPFYDAAQQVQMPVLFHAGLDRGLPPPVHAMPDGLLKVHRQFPGMVMVAAHMGGEDNYDETEALLLGEDIYLDTSYILRVMPPAILKRFFRKHPVERIIFGSDSPFRDPAVELDYLLNLSFLSDAQKEKVAYSNAATLLNLEI